MDQRNPFSDSPRPAPPINYEPTLPVSLPRAQSVPPQGTDDHGYTPAEPRIATPETPVVPTPSPLQAPLQPGEAQPSPLVGDATSHPSSNGAATPPSNEGTRAVAADPQTDVRARPPESEPESLQPPASESGYESKSPARDASNNQVQARSEGLSKHQSDTTIPAADAGRAPEANTLDFNKVANLIRWVGAVRKRTGLQQLEDLLAIFKLMGHLPSVVEQLILKAENLNQNSDQTDEKTFTLEDCIDSLLRLHGILYGQEYHLAGRLPDLGQPAIGPMGR